MKAVVVPIFRIFDVHRAKEFYIDWLGFQVDWEHRFEENTPVYMQISRDRMYFHLSEHSGDCSPGAKAFIDCDDVKSFFEEISTRPYKYNRPSLQTTDWNTLTLELIDPFSNKLLFSQDMAKK